MNYTGNLLGVLSARDSVLYQVYSKVPVYNPHSPRTDRGVLAGTFFFASLQSIDNICPLFHEHEPVTIMARGGHDDLAPTYCNRCVHRHQNTFCRSIIIIIINHSPSTDRGVLTGTFFFASLQSIVNICPLFHEHEPVTHVLNGWCHRFIVGAWKRV
jgi:hypothetical protein